MYTLPSNQNGATISRNDSLQFTPHLAEWVEGSGVDLGIAKLNPKSQIDRKAIAHRIGWDKYSDDLPLGWLVSGLDLNTMKIQEFGQFKPDEPILLPGEDKPSKYLTPSKKKGLEHDAIALQHPSGVEYWQQVLDDASQPVPVGEGVKKTGALMTCGFSALSVCGVEMGLIKGKLVKNLAAVAVPGRPIPIIYDADLLTKKEVQLALKKLAKVLIKQGCIVTVAIIPAELDCKGIDDVLVTHGPEMVQKIMAEAQPYAQWLKNLENQINSIAKTPDTGNERTAKKPPIPRDIAARVAEQYGHQLKYDDQQQTWRKWSGKHWEKMSIGAFGSWLKTTLDAKNVLYTGSAFLEDVRKLLEHDLRQLKWQFWDKSRYINFSNCVFDGAEAKTLEHSPGMGFTSLLPYEFKELIGNLSDVLEALRVNCPEVYNFFSEAMKGDPRKMLKLLAIINGILKYRFFDLQMLVHLVGAPGSGKGKFMRLCEKLVGALNTIACKLDRLSDGSTVASLIDKQLVVFPDERKPTGIDSILSLTGGDTISYRELYQPAASAHFYGCPMIASNKPIFIGDTTGLERRLCLVGFDNPIATDKRDHSLEAKLDAEIPALIAVALSMTDLAVTQAIRGTGANQIVEFKAKEWEMKTETDSIAAFFDSELVVDATASTETGRLYEAYKAFCEASGLSKFSIVKFPRILADLLADEKIPATRHQGRIAFFAGLRMRKKDDEHPTHSEHLSRLAGVGGVISGSLAGVGAGVEPLPDIHQRELRELDTIFYQEIKNDISEPPPIEKTESEIVKGKGFSPSTPATPADALPVRDTTPAQLPQKSHTSPAVGANHKTFAEGDRVVVAEQGNIHHGQEGTITAIGYGSRETDYSIKLDKVSRGNETITVTVPTGCKFVYLMKL